MLGGIHQFIIDDHCILYAKTTEMRCNMPFRNVIVLESVLASHDADGNINGTAEFLSTR